MLKTERLQSSITQSREIFPNIILSHYANIQRKYKNYDNMLVTIYV
jgi:hypothetical protein